MKKKKRGKTTLARTRTHAFNRRAKKAKRSNKKRKNTEGKNRIRKERKVSFCMSLTDTATDTQQRAGMKSKASCEAWAVPRKWRQYLPKDAPIYILRSCWLAECEGSAVPNPTLFASTCSCPTASRRTDATRKWQRGRSIRNGIMLIRKAVGQQELGERWGRREHGVPGSSRQNVGCQLAVCQLGGLRWRAWVMVLPVASRCQADALAAGPDATVSTHACTHTYAKRAALIAVLSVCPAGKSFSCLVPSRTHITWPKEIEKWQLPER